MVINGNSQTLEIIIPAAGASTRFPNLRPKYLLNAYDGELMIEKSLAPYLGKYSITIGVLADHAEKYSVLEIFADVFGEMVKVVVLPEPTRGPADTVYQILKRSKTNPNTSILVKDCDSFFSHQRIIDQNCVFVDSLTNNPDIRNAANKSYVNVNNQMIVNNIIEKKIVSEWFCVGGYQFATAKSYMDTCEILFDKISNELYVSSVIDYMLSNGLVFSAVGVKNWIDVGTKEDWHRYNSKPTIFVDIDGTLIQNQGAWGENNHGTPAIPLIKNTELLQQAIKNGSQVIFTTARSFRFQKQTREMLDSLGFQDCQLLMNLHHSQRILINDYAPSNPYPSAVAINIPRNSDTLADYLDLKNLFGR